MFLYLGYVPGDEENVLLFPKPAEWKSHVKKVVRVARDCFLARVECIILNFYQTKVFHLTPSKVLTHKRQRNDLYDYGLDWNQNDVQEVKNMLRDGVEMISTIPKVEDGVDSGAGMLSENIARLSLSTCSSEELRPIVIDGSNVAKSHGQGGEYSIRGIELVIRYFEKRGHKTIVAFLPEFHKSKHMSSDQGLLFQLEKERRICFTPSRKVDGKRVTPHDDTYILEYAVKSGAIVVSRDHFRDLIDEKPEYAEVIKKRILPQTFVCGDDDVMFPPDPLGRGGPNLDDFLRF